MTGLVAPPTWFSPPGEPGDQQFAGVVEPEALEGAGGYPAVLLGEAVGDHMATPTGADSWPGAVREALAWLRPHHLDTGSVGPVADLGTIRFVEEGPGDETVRGTVRDFAGRVYRTDTVPLFLSDDGALAVPNAQPLLDRGSLGVLSFDGHLNCRPVSGEPAHRSMCRALFEAGLDALAVVGARQFETPSTEHAFCRERRGTVVPADAVGTDPRATVADALDALGDVDTVFVHVDVDVVGTDTPGGLGARELFGMLGGCAVDHRLAGVQVVGDPTEPAAQSRPARIGATAVAHLLAGREGRR